MNPLRLTLAMTATLALSAPTLAQVYRCQMPNGGTQFSDTPCPTSAVKAERHMGSRATTSEWVPDGYRLQEQLDSAYRSRAIIQDRAQDEVNAVAAPPGSGLAVFSDGRQARDQDREKFFKDAERRTSRARLSPEERARLDYFERHGGRSRRNTDRGTSDAPIDPVPAAAAPGRLTNCDGAGCWDTGGNRYNSAAGGNFYRSDGKFCMRVGPNLTCN